MVLDSEISPRSFILGSKQKSVSITAAWRVGSSQHITGKSLRKKGPSLPTKLYINKQWQEMAYVSIHVTRQGWSHTIRPEYFKWNWLTLSRQGMKLHNAIRRKVHWCLMRQSSSWGVSSKWENTHLCSLGIGFVPVSKCVFLFLNHIFC